MLASVRQRLSGIPRVAAVIETASRIRHYVCIMIESAIPLCPSKSVIPCIDIVSLPGFAAGHTPCVR